MVLHWCITPVPNLAFRNPGPPLSRRSERLLLSGEDAIAPREEAILRLLVRPNARWLLAGVANDEDNAILVGNGHVFGAAVGGCGSATASTTHASTTAGGKQAAAKLGDSRLGVRSEVGAECEIAPPLDLGAECGECAGDGSIGVRAEQQVGRRVGEVDEP
jgi:hypothetical protein